MSRQQLEARLKELKAEYSAGQRQMAELERKQIALKQTLERINQAIKELKNNYA